MVNLNKGSVFQLAGFASIMILYNIFVNLEAKEGGKKFNLIYG